MIDRNLFLSSDGISFDGKRSVPSEEVTKLMLGLADLQPGEKVLEIGTGSGYQTCHLAETGASVCTVDTGDSSVPPKFSPPVKEIILGIVKTANQKVYSQHGDGRNGLSMDAPYDCIFVTCGMSEIPPAYEEQLREGGRLVIPLGKPDGQELLRLEKRNGKLVMGRVGGYCRFQMAS